LRDLAEVVMTLDEVEALRLADLDGLYQEQAGEQMKVSRATFARIVESARRKVADALIHGKALRLEGGVIIVKTADQKMSGGNGRGSCGSGQRPGACRKQIPDKPKEQ
jgi:predicted DNA-binding protein (UPF0251 family)